MYRYLAFFGLVACLPAVSMDGKTDAEETGVSNDSGLIDTNPRTYANDFRWCVDFEDGVLDGVGYSGKQVQLGNGALLAVVEEGQDFSALRAEEQIEFRGEKGVILRSSPGGDLASVSIATTPLFEVTDREFSWWQLSEVDEDGVWMAADVLGSSGQVLGSMRIPVETGGHLPGLKSTHAPIPDLEEIQYGPGTPGQLVGQPFDLTDFLGIEIQIRIYQHTRIKNSAFFTLMDDFCLGWTEELEDQTALVFGEPFDWGL